jgi:hypothetical protein
LYSETNDTKQSSTPSTDNLDPLQNPLLNQHMGRWAEVYCTTPPEQRDQAVSELLRELEAEQRQQKTVSRQQATGDKRNFTAAGGVASSLWVPCPFCGYGNPADNVFCGSCRAELRNATFDSTAADPDDGESSAASFSRSFQAQHRENALNGVWHSRQTKSPAEGLTALQASSAHAARLVDSSADHEANHNDDDAARADDSDSFHFSSYSGSSSSSYRVYIGIVLALIIAFLVYRAWLSTKSAADETGGPPHVPPAATSPKTPSRAPSAQPAASAPAETAPAEPKTGVPPPANSRSAPPPPLVNQQSAAEATPAAPAPPSSANGSAELSMAKSYLNGTDGKQPNPSDAIPLLWNAVGKQNAEATELLANAYLTGEGVSKNCDQAHVLLDAAARKGRKDAGERLRHLQAFGCQ